MLDLFRRVSFLFWQFPTLWLPVAIADLIGLGTLQLQRWTTQSVVRSLVMGHSVLSNIPEPVQTLPTAWALIFGVTRFFAVFFELYIYTAAMVAISVLVPSLIIQAGIEWRDIFLALNRVSFRILLFCLKMVAIIVVVAILSMWLIVFLPRIGFLPIEVTTLYARDFGAAIFALLSAAGAWLIAPAAVTLLRPLSTPRLLAGPAREARTSAALTAIAASTVYLMAIHVEHAFISSTTSGIGIQIFWTIESLIAAVPYLLLFIALTLIANPEHSSSLADEIPLTSLPPDSPPPSISA